MAYDHDIVADNNINSTPNSNSLVNSITDKANVMKIKRVSPMKSKQREHVSRLNKTNHYYTKTMTGIKNNNAQSFGTQ